MAGGRQGAAGFDPGRLRAARMAAKLTQTALAAAADVHPNEVGYWEAGTRVPQVETVAVLARALGLRPADLLEPSASGRPTLRQLRGPDCSLPGCRCAGDSGVTHRQRQDTRWNLRGHGRCPGPKRPWPGCSRTSSC